MTEQTRPELEAEINSDLDENWLPLLKTDGQWDEQKIRNELHDLVFIYHQVAEVYEYITRGKLSKPMYYADVIKQQFDEAINEAVKDAMADRLEEVGFLERQHAASQERAEKAEQAYRALEDLNQRNCAEALRLAAGGNAAVQLMMVGHQVEKDLRARLAEVERERDEAREREERWMMAVTHGPCKCDPPGSGEELCSGGCYLSGERDSLARELGAAREALERLTAVLNQDGGWCNHGVLMDRPYHPRCSHCVLNQVRSAIAAGETDR
jgi:hypothetical protein